MMGQLSLKKWGDMVIERGGDPKDFPFQDGDFCDDDAHAALGDAMLQIDAIHFKANGRIANERELSHYIRTVRDPDPGDDYIEDVKYLSKSRNVRSRVAANSLSWFRHKRRCDRFSGTLRFDDPALKETNFGNRATVIDGIITDIQWYIPPTTEKNHYVEIDMEPTAWADIKPGTAYWVLSAMIMLDFVASVEVENETTDG